MDLLLPYTAKMCVVVEGEKSRPVDVGSGVPQGTVLGLYTIKNDTFASLTSGSEHSLKYAMYVTWHNE